MGGPSAADRGFAVAELATWSAASGSWQSRPPGEITWLDRDLLSGGKDRTLHRAPRCPGLRFVHHRWEVFSRDVTHTVYIAASPAGTAMDHTAVEAAAQFVLPAANGDLEARPARLDAGVWLISVGTWVLPVCINTADASRDQPTVPPAGGLATMQEMAAGRAPGTDPAPDAVARVERYFERNPLACLAMAYYYQDFIRGGVAPQPVPIAHVAIELDLTGEGAVSEYKKELQRRIWNEQGHQRELGEFLLKNGLISRADLERATRMAAANEASGRTAAARERLRYISRKRK